MSELSFKIAGGFVAVYDRGVFICRVREGTPYATIREIVRDHRDERTERQLGLDLTR